jgi:hypothetical protein
MALYPLGLLLPPSLSASLSSLCFVHVKPHYANPVDTTEPSGLFMSGLPLSLAHSEQRLTEAFSGCFADARVATVVLHPSRRSALLILGHQGAADDILCGSTSQKPTISAVREAMAAALEGRAVQVQDSAHFQGRHQETAGLKAWVAAHKMARPGLEVLQASLNAWTDAYETQVSTLRVRGVSYVQ